MTITVEELAGLDGRVLPGGDIVVEPHENAILESALQSPEAEPGVAHPMWFVVISLRCMGVTVDELCDLAGKSEADTLLFGSCEIDQQMLLRVAGRYRAEAVVAATASRTTRDGSRLDSLTIRTEIFSDGGEIAGAVTSTYLFKRGDTR